ncbi:MAG: hypothetical protein DRP85_05315 [Candidatus Makaraimicrobium thalassicum]|nr:MAG: hypothetical protein DRP85_05315 [Candidatus Omnitrophota bacterium]
MKKTLIIFTAVFLFVSGFARAEDMRLEAALERNRAAVGNPLYLYVTFYGSQSVERPEMPSLDGLQIKYVGPSTKISVVNGRVSRFISHMYLVIPLKSGRFEIGPFFVESHGQIYKAPAVTLTADGAPAAAQARAPGALPAGNEPQGAPSYVSDRVFLVMDIGKRLVYINEIVPVTIKVYLMNVQGLRDIEYPVYPHEGFSAGELAEPEKRTELVHGVRYNVLVFRQDLFGIKEGDYILGPAKLRCNLITRKQSSRRSSIFDIDDFFSRRFGYRTYPIELESKDIPVSILPLPEDGRPRDFQGAVGDFAMDVNVNPPEVKVGDPVVLRMTISGEGNLDTVTAPCLLSAEKFKTYEPQVTKKGGKKIYEQVIIPKTDEVKEVPEVVFSFFDPESGQYKTIRKGPFPLDVVEQPESERGVKMVSMPGVDQMFYPGEKLGRDIIYIKENIGDLRRKGRFLYRNPLFWAGQFMPLVLFGVFCVKHRRKERILRDKSYARFLKAPRKARKGLARARAYLGRDDVLPFYDVIFKTLQEYLGGRFDLPRGNVTIQVIEDRLRPARVDESILGMLRDVFSRCEMARYASSVPGGHEAKEILEKARRIISYMEKIKL